MGSGCHDDEARFTITVSLDFKHGQFKTAESARAAVAAQLGAAEYTIRRRISKMGMEVAEPVIVEGVK